MDNIIKLIFEPFKDPLHTRIKNNPIWSIIIATIFLTGLITYFMIIPMVKYHYDGEINTLKAKKEMLTDEKEKLEKEILSFKSNQESVPNAQSHNNNPTLYVIPPPSNPKITLKDINIQGMGVPTAIGTETGSGINVKGQSVDLQNVGIKGAGLESGVKTEEDNSPVTTNNTSIEATKIGILTTGNNSSVNAPNSNITR